MSVGRLTPRGAMMRSCFCSPYAHPISKRTFGLGLSGVRIAMKRSARSISLRKLESSDSVSLCFAWHLQGHHRCDAALQKYRFHNRQICRKGSSDETALNSGNTTCCRLRFIGAHAITVLIGVYIIWVFNRFCDTKYGNVATGSMS